MGALSLELTGRSCALNSELFLKSKGGYQVQRSVRTDKGGQQHETRKPNILKHGCSVWWVAVSYTHLTLPTTLVKCRSRWSPYH